MNTHRLTVMVMIRVASFIFHPRAAAVFKHYSVNTARNVYENHKSHILSLVALIRTMFFFPKCHLLLLLLPIIFHCFRELQIGTVQFYSPSISALPIVFFFLFLQITMVGLSQSSFNTSRNGSIAIEMNIDHSEMC